MKPKPTVSKKQFSLGSSIEVSPVKTKSEKHISKQDIEKTKHKSSKTVKPVDIIDILPKKVKNSEPSSSKLLLSKHPDVNITKSQTGKKFDFSQAPSVSITTVKRDKLEGEKTDLKKMSKKPTVVQIPSDDDVICID